MRSGRLTCLLLAMERSPCLGLTLVTACRMPPATFRHSKLLASILPLGSFCLVDFLYPVAKSDVYSMMSWNACTRCIKLQCT
ncbi:hypothetical protein IQ06DRAFT_16603 [Phaeosphaeriaceae sp. SRC1lsM3a]|nr:hypothetical protein IQ06DRAFT_16603 [Stagonospora sp. SRC1lsM3a]